MEVVRNSKWKRKTDNSVVRVMAVADGWVMVRIPHCVPFTRSVKEFVEQFDKVAI